MITWLQWMMCVMRIFHLDRRCKGIVCGDRKKCVVPRGETRPKCVCMTNEDCNDDFHPICANDNKTYQSLCHMYVSGCTRGIKLDIQSDGPCPGECPKVDYTISTTLIYTCTLLKPQPWGYFSVCKKY